MNNKELLFSINKKDFNIQTFRCGGNGGQKLNKTNSGVRIIHRESGAIGESRTERSQYQNKKIAFKRLINSQIFQMWLNKKIFELSMEKKEIERQISLMMKNENLKIEGKKDGKWIIIK